jgi:uncharacterized protein (DUF779 family)
LRRHDTLAGKLPWLGGCCNGGLTMVLRGEQSLVGARRVLMLDLSGRCRDVLLVRSG